MAVSLIVIADQEYGIGQGNGTPWYFPAHQEYFEQLVSGHPVVMGRTTYESRGTVSGSVNMVVTHQSDYVVDEPGVMVDTDLYMAIERCQWLDGGEQVFVVGGAELFEYCLVAGVVNKLYLTHISRKTYDCDVFFQDSYLKDWFNESHRTVRYPDADNPERLEFIVYNKRYGNQAKDKKRTQ